MTLPADPELYALNAAAAPEVRVDKEDCTTVCAMGEIVSLKFPLPHWKIKKSRAAKYFLIYDIVVPSESSWELQGAVDFPEELCGSRLLSLGPRATFTASGLRTEEETEFQFNSLFESFFVQHAKRKDSDLSPPPRLIVQVIGLCSLGRQILEGYGFADLWPLGEREVSIPLWAPVIAEDARRNALCGVFSPLVSRLLAGSEALDRGGLVTQSSAGHVVVRMQHSLAVHRSLSTRVADSLADAPNMERRRKMWNKVKVRFAPSRPN